jgi:hypothetical protein
MYGYLNDGTSAKTLGPGTDVTARRSDVRDYQRRTAARGKLRSNSAKNAAAETFELLRRQANLVTY